MPLNMFDCTPVFAQTNSIHKAWNWSQLRMVYRQLIEGPPPCPEKNQSGCQIIFVINAIPEIAGSTHPSHGN